MSEELKRYAVARGDLLDPYSDPRVNPNNERVVLATAHDRVVAALTKRLAESERIAAARNVTIGEQGQKNAALLARCEKAEARLAKAIESLKQWASECGECNGKGLCTIYNYDGHGSDADDQPCDQCEDIRTAIKEVSP